MPAVGRERLICDGYATSTPPSEADISLRRTKVMLRSGGIEARIGLRMMPTFPRSPLSFRTAGFPQYGWKAGLSGGAFPDGTQLKSAPDIRCMSAGLHSPFVHLVITAMFPL